MSDLKIEEKLNECGCTYVLYQNEDPIYNYCPKHTSDLKEWTKKRQEIEAEKRKLYEEIRKLSEMEKRYIYYSRQLRENIKTDYKYFEENDNRGDGGGYDTP